MESMNRRQLLAASAAAVAGVALPGPTRREQIIASIPPVEDLDLIAIDPPAEWLAEKGWSEPTPAPLPPDAPKV